MEVGLNLKLVAKSFRYCYEFQVNDCNSRSISPVKEDDLKYNERRYNEIEILDTPKDLKKLKSSNVNQLENFNEPTILLNDHACNSPHFLSSNSLKYYPKSKGSSRTVPFTLKNESKFWNDEFNISIHQCDKRHSRSLKFNYSLNHLKERRKSSMNKPRVGAKCKPRTKELKDQLKKGSQRSVPNKSNSGQNDKELKFKFKLKKTDNSGFDTEEEDLISKPNKSFLLKSQEEFEKQFFNTTKNKNLNRSAKQLSYTNAAAIIEQGNELDRTFQLHQIIFNNSLNKDMSKNSLNHTSSPLHSTLQQDEIYESDQFCIDNLFGKTITLSPELKINKVNDQDRKKMSVDFYLRQNDRLLTNRESLSLSNPQMKKLTNGKLSSSQTFDDRTKTKETVLLTKYSLYTGLSDSKVQQAQTEVFREDNLSSQLKVMNSEINKANTASIKNPSLPGVLNNSSKESLSEDELFIRFNKRGWICVYCHNFNFEGKSYLLNVVRKECNRCKVLKYAKKKAIDPITGLYLDRVSAINPIYKQVIEPIQSHQGQQLGFQSNPYISNNPISKPVGSALSGNNLSNFSLTSPYNNTNIVQSKNYHPQFVNNNSPSFSNIYYPNNNISNQHQPQYSYYKNYYNPLAYSSNVSKQVSQVSQVPSYSQTQLMSINYGFRSPILHPSTIFRQNQVINSPHNLNPSQNLYNNAGFFTRPSY